jgi:hypothetical protein
MALPTSGYFYPAILDFLNNLLTNGKYMHDPKEFNDGDTSFARMEELDEELETNIIPDDKDLEVEEEMKLTNKEEEWLEELKRKVTEWKANRSSFASDGSGVENAILHIKDDFDQEDVKLFHRFQLVVKRPSVFMRQEFGKLMRKRLREFDAQRDTTAYRLAKILESLSPKED